MKTDRKKSNITHKELLTFSNLTNLDWYFVDLEGELVKKKNNNKNTINDLLTPEVFVETDETGKAVEYRYGGYREDGEAKVDIEKGKAELRREAGIAMEYLEKWQRWQDTDNKEGTDEGSFLSEWEVIYGGDNYQVVTDYLYQMYRTCAKYLNSTEESKEKSKEDLEGELYPARENINETQKIIATIEVVFEAGDLVLTAVTCEEGFYEKVNCFINFSNVSFNRSRLSATIRNN